MLRHYQATIMMKTGDVAFVGRDGMLNKIAQLGIALKRAWVARMAQHMNQGISVVVATIEQQIHHLRTISLQHDQLH